MQLTYAVSNIMTENIVSVNADASLDEAIKAMVENNIGSVLVASQGKMVGILTERDVLKHFYHVPGNTGQNVVTIMSSPLVAVEGSAAIGEAADLMAQKRVRRLLVTEKGIIRGIVTERDLMRATLDVFNKLFDAWV